MLCRGDSRVRRTQNARMTHDTDIRAEDLHGTVLYIEDNPVNIDLIETALSSYPNVRLIKATTGMEGIQLARSAHPDFVLLDMHLGDISGLEVVRALNEEIASGKLHITLLTADSLSMDIVKAMSLGAEEYWLKPFSIAKLHERVRRALTKKETT